MHINFNRHVIRTLVCDKGLFSGLTEKDESWKTVWMVLSDVHGNAFQHSLANHLWFTIASDSTSDNITMHCFGFTMPWQCPGNSRTMPWQCPDNALTMPWQCPDNVLTMSWQCPDNVLTMSWQCPDNALTMPWQCCSLRLLVCNVTVGHCCCCCSIVSTNLGLLFQPVLHYTSLVTLFYHTTVEYVCIKCPPPYSHESSCTG